jgi:hypothetical protein
MPHIEKQPIITIDELFEKASNNISMIDFYFNVNIYNFKEFAKLVAHFNGKNSFRIVSDQISFTVEMQSFIEDMTKRRRSRYDISFCSADDIIDFVHNVKNHFALLLD